MKEAEKLPPTSETFRSPPFTDVDSALEDLRRGRMIVVVDDEDRENEGDLILPAETVTAERINFMAKHGRGLICLSLAESHADRLGLRPMVRTNTDRLTTAFTESIDARLGVSTGISAQDRAHTIRVAASSSSTAADFVRPGHIFPLRAKPGGVLDRMGHTEASVDLAAMAGFAPAAVICEIMSLDGTMARVPELMQFCRCHGMKMLTIAAIVRYRLERRVTLSA